jgi:hypothetical protein
VCSAASSWQLASNILIVRHSPPYSSRQVRWLKVPNVIVGFSLADALLHIGSFAKVDGIRSQRLGIKLILLHCLVLGPSAHDTLSRHVTQSGNLLQLHGFLGERQLVLDARSVSVKAVEGLPALINGLCQHEDQDGQATSEGMVGETADR